MRNPLISIASPILGPSPIIVVSLSLAGSPSPAPWLWPAAAPALGGACAASRSSPDADRRGAVSGAAFDGPADTVTATPVFRAGGIDGRGPAAFGRVEALEIDGERVYVLDGLEHELRIFALEGPHLRTVGREGEGPGEFLAPVGLAWSPGGDLWVIDPESQRATAYSAGGDRLRDARVPAGFALSPWPGRFDASGRLYSYVESAGEPYGIEMVRYDADFAPEATVAPPSSPDEESFFVGRTERGSDLRARVPFTPRFVWRLSSAGEFWSMWTAAFEVFRHGPGAAPARVLARDAATVALDADEREAAIAGLARFEELGGRVDRSRIPARKPPVRTFVLDDEDRIWVWLDRPAGVGDTVFEVFASSGAPLGTVRVPDRLEAIPPPVVRGGRLAAVVRDGLGVDAVAVFDVGAVAR